MKIKSLNDVITNSSQIENYEIIEDLEKYKNLEYIAH